MDRNAKRVAICQAKSIRGDLQKNVATIMEWMEKAAKAGADIALFGELFLSDYDLDNIPSTSEAENGPTANAIGKTAERLGIAVIYGYCEVDGSQYYNSLLFIDEHGNKRANYRKVHLWPGAETRYFRAGDVPVVVEWKGVKIGMAICVDICMAEFMTMMVANGGAQMIVVANALVDPPRYDNTSRVIVPCRAFENRCFIAYIDLAGEKYSGKSLMVDPHAQCLASASSNDETILLSTVDVEKCNKVPFTYNTLRRPEVYTIPYKNEIPWEIDLPEHVQNFFKHRACYYDKQMAGIYSGPAVAAGILSSFVPEDMRDKKVLDVAAGTGLMGKALSEKGFTNLTALDRSDEMLKHAISKKIYSDIICGSFEEEAKVIPDQSFFACTCVGAFLTLGFLDPATTVEQMVRIVEEGGYILLLVNETELEKPKCKDVKESLETTCDKIVMSQFCECSHVSKISRYLDECEGKLWIFKKMPSIS